jgi:ATP-dependent helicase/nuclease subunit B
VTGLSTRKAIATIGPEHGFLTTLAGWWLSRAGPEPLAAAEGIFLVPTRRAARGLRDAFLEQAGGRALLLPRIVALGALDEASLALAGALSLPPPVPAAERLAMLCRFILRMDGAHGAPTSADRAWPLAVELAALLDEAARAEIDLVEALPRAAGEDFADHWNVTLTFLEIVTRFWPEALRAAGYSDIAAHQIALLNAQCAAWQDAPPGVRVIAAGSTGAIPAVARLLGVVARLPGGLVVLIWRWMRRAGRRWMPPIRRPVSAPCSTRFPSRGVMWRRWPASPVRRTWPPGSMPGAPPCCRPRPCNAGAPPRRRRPRA